MKVKVTTLGNSTGIILPKELLEKLHISNGDILYVTKTSRGIELSPYDQDFFSCLLINFDKIISIKT